MANTLAGLARRSFWLLFGGIWLLVGTPFLLIGVIPLGRQLRYELQAVPAAGTVLRKEVTRSSSTNRRYDVYIDYRFTTSDNRVISGREKVAAAYADRLSVNGPVSVLYLPQGPDSSRLKGTTDWALQGIFTGLGGLFGGVGAFLFFRSLFQVWGDWQLLQSGVLAAAQVTDVVETNLSVNNVRQWQVRFQYQDNMGGTFSRKSGYLSPKEAAEWHTGDSGMVRFDPQRPGRCVWVGRDDSAAPPGALQP